MRLLYSLIIHLLRPFAFGVVLWRGFGNRAYWEGLHERVGLGARSCVQAGARQCLWVHAVSLGEVSAARRRSSARWARAIRSCRWS